MGLHAQTITQMGVDNGLRGAGQSAIVSGSTVAILNKIWPKFNRGLGVSGKVALAITPPIFVFMVQMQLTINHFSQKRASAVMDADLAKRRAAGQVYEG